MEKARVVLIEDKAHLREIYIQSLRNSGFEVDSIQEI